MLKKLDIEAGKFYLSLNCAEDYSEQELEYKKAKWYDLFWLLLPIIGFVIFMEIIENR